MNMLDIIILIVVSIGLIKGFIKGAVAEIFGLLAVILGFWVTTVYHESIKQYLKDYTTPENINLIAYLTCFIAVFLITLLLGKLITKTLKVIALGPINRVLGSIVGGSKYLLLILFVLILIIIAFDSVKQTLPDIISQSNTLQYLKDFKLLRLIQDSLNTRQNFTL